MGGPITNQPLQTEEARRAHLHAIFGHRFTMQGKLQLPQLTTYNQLDNDKGLQELGAAICRWIGLKPNGLTIKLADTYIPSEYHIDIKTKQILIDPGYTKHPYSCGAILAIAVTTYAITRSTKVDPDRELVELATIELGISLWIINALAPKTTHYLRIYHLIDSSWQEKETLFLQAFSTAQYVENVVQYAHENRIPADEYLPHITKKSQTLIPVFIRNQSSRFLPEPHMIHQHIKAARIFWAKIILAALVITSALCLAIYVASTKVR